MFSKLKASLSTKPPGNSGKSGSTDESRAPLVAPEEAVPLVEQPASDPVDQVTQWFLKASKEELHDMMKELAEMRPKELKQIAAKTKTSVERPSAASNESTHDVHIELTPPTDPTALGKKQTTIEDLPILQFSCGKYFCLEGEPTVKITAIRVGSIEERSSVKYRTTEKSAIKDVNYHHAEGTIVWERGDVSKTVEVGLIDDNHWAGVVEFRVVLEDAENGIISSSAGQARVQRIDDDVFPSNKYRDQILNRQVQDINPFGLFFEFVKLVYDDPTVAKGSVRLLFVGQLENAFGLLQLVMSMFMVDHVLLVPEELRNPSRQTTMLCILTGITFIPQAVMHTLRYMSFSWGVVGKTRMKLASGLMNAFLFFDDTARTDVDAGALVDSMTIDTDMLIKGGYMNFLVVCQLLGRILLCVLFQLVAPILSGKPGAPIFSARMLPMLVFPVFMGLLMWARVGPTRALLSVRLQKQRHLVAAVHEIANNFRLIADFGRRQWCMDQHQDNVQAYGKADREVAELSCNNVYFMKWLTLFAVSAYVILGGIDVIEGTLNTGVFLTCLKVLTKVGALWGQVYAKFLETFNNAPALERIVETINKHSDMRTRMELSRRQHTYTDKALMDLGQDRDAKPGTAFQDRIPIVVQYVRMNMHAMATSKDRAGECVRETNMVYDEMRIHQGKLVCLIGKRGMGKSALLRILGGAQLPQTDPDGVFFIPSHLRVLHVPAEDMFIKGSLYENLTLGVQPGHSDGDPARVRDICTRLKLPMDLIETIKPETASPSLSWAETLSGSEKHMLVIARALIANPEVLCIHKPTLHVNDSTAENITTLLREFVDQRGIGLPRQDRHLRRPRTCIMTSTRLRSIMKADAVFKIAARVDREGKKPPCSIIEISRDRIEKEITQEDLH